jgi:two-component system, chemotaxis family, sensor kinase CheA
MHWSAKALRGRDVPSPVTAVRRRATASAVSGNADQVPEEIDRGLLSDFLTESRESLASAEAAMLALESRPDDTEAINTIFRAFHTVKGTASFLGMAQLAASAHRAESLLSRVRDGALEYTPAIATRSLHACDVLSGLLRDIERGVTGPGDAPQHRRDSVERSVRVRTDHIEQLNALLETLVIAHARVTADPALSTGGHPELARTVAAAGAIVQELQAVGLSMRMVPLRATFQKVARLVRDVAMRAGKVVTLELSGDDTELDRALVDAIADPLLHMVRNAIDHGLESPAERVRAGKAPCGRVTLTATQEPDGVRIELCDDGRGLPRDRIQRKAVERGLITPTHTLTVPQLDALIFSPGFSTAEHLTELSGRGVGMDVVRRNIESIRGRIDVHSVAGAGTTFVIRIPRAAPVR